VSQALITINAVLGSNDNLPINVSVALNNINDGGEVAYLWEILDQPIGAADLLSNALIQNPTFTPKKEGTYLIRLTVNKNLPDEQHDQVIVGIEQLKTGLRIPAAGETVQDSTSKGWEIANNAYLLAMDKLLSDPGKVVGVAGTGGLQRGNVLQSVGVATIKSGLPGQEIVPSFTLAPASALANVEGLLVVLEGDVAGNPNPSNGAIIVTRYIGRFAGAAFASTPGTLVYVDDTGNLSTTQGTVRRQVGTVMASSGGSSDIWVDGVGGADITPITAPYVLFGAPASGMTNAVRVDGTNATALAGPARFKSGAIGVTPLQVQAFSGQTADLFQALNSGGSAITTLDANGNIVFKGTGQGATWPHWTFQEDGSQNLTATKTSAATFAAKWLNNAAHGAVIALSATPAVQFGSGASSNYPIEFLVNNARTWQIATGVTSGLQPVGGNGVLLISNSDSPVATFGATFRGIAAGDQGLYMAGIAGANASPGGAGGRGGNAFGANGGNGLGPGDAGGNAGLGFIALGGTGGNGGSGGDPAGSGGHGLYGSAGHYGVTGTLGTQSTAMGVLGLGLNIAGIAVGIPATAGVGAFGFPGVDTSGIPTNPALLVADGHAWFAGANPATTDKAKNVQTPLNIPKAWGVVDVNSTGPTATVLEGFNIDTGATTFALVGSLWVLTVTFAQGIAGGHQCCAVASGSDVNSSQCQVTNGTTSFSITLKTATGGNPSGAFGTTRIHFVVFGLQ
jgi:hypothetical protein